MSAASKAETTTPSAEALVSEYEGLRRMVLGASGATPGTGFALFLRRGMAAWMEACTTAASAFVTRHPPMQEDRVVPSDLRGEVAMVLVSMALSCRTEGGLTT